MKPLTCHNRRFANFGWYELVRCWYDTVRAGWYDAGTMLVRCWYDAGSMLVRSGTVLYGRAFGWYELVRCWYGVVSDPFSQRIFTIFDFEGPEGQLRIDFCL